MKAHRRIVMPFGQLRRLPLAVESVGINPDQERILRPDGYPYYHWLQTLSGSGRITVADRTYPLPSGTGFLLFPGVAHAYEADEDGCWETAYLTFGGAAADGMLASMGVHQSTYLQWPADVGLDRLIGRIVDRLEQGGDVFGIEASSAAYHFLLTLTRYGSTQPGRKNGDDRHEQLRAVVEWMESRIDDPSVGMEQIASVLRLSNRRVTGLFRETFGQPPYAYSSSSGCARRRRCSSAPPRSPCGRSRGGSASATRAISSRRSAATSA